MAFQPTRPLRGATGTGDGERDTAKNFNPRAPCGARRSIVEFNDSLHKISTHAPLAGRDPIGVIDRGKKLISTHAPLAGRDHKEYGELTVNGVFQPTRPLRGATAIRDRNLYEVIFQPTRPLRGATFSVAFPTETRTNFNPRAPCGARRISVARPHE